MIFRGKFAVQAVLISVLAVCGVLISAQDTLKYNQSGTQFVKISMQKDRIPLGELPIVVLTIENLTNHEIPQYIATDKYRIHVEGKNAEPPTTLYHRRITGKLLPKDSIERTQRTGPEVVFSIQAGESRTMKFDLSRYYDLSQPGKYSVYLEVHDDAGTWLRTNTLQFQIVSGSQ